MRVNIGDCRLFFDVEGLKLRPDGPRMREVPTLLLLHGGPSYDHSTFKPYLSPLAEDAQIIYLDHRSQGRSDSSQRDLWTIAQCAEDVRTFCRALDIEHPIVMGNSFGGMVAMAYAVRYPEDPGKLILCSTSARPYIERILSVFERLGGIEAREAAYRSLEKPSAEAFQEYLRVCWPLVTRSAAMVDWDAWNRMVLKPGVGRHFNAEIRGLNLLRDLAKIRCASLVLAGEDDPLTPIEDAEDIAAALPCSLVRLERFANAGHGVFRDAPEHFLRVVREFIRS